MVSAVLVRNQTKIGVHQSGLVNKNLKPGLTNGLDRRPHSTSENTQDSGKEDWNSSSRH